MDSQQKLKIVCLSTQLWDDPMWTNKQHVMSRLARRGHQILYVDPLIRVRKFLKHLVQGKYFPLRIINFVKEPMENVRVFSPVKFLFLESMEKGFNLTRIKNLISKYRLSPTILWVYDPEFADYPSQIPHRLLIYDCVDDYGNFPESRYPQGKDWILKKEEKLIREADIIFTTAKSLYEKKKKLNPNTYYTPNVADFDHNRKALDPDLALPKDIADLPRPVIGFQGALASYKIDLELLERTARENPNWSFALIGPKAPVDPQTDLSGLQSLKNLYFLGLKKYADLPKYYKAFDVAILPSAINSYTEGSFPLKFFEYLGAGLPVVSTKLPALKDYWGKDYVYFADSRDEFAQKIHLALEEKKRADLVQKRLNVAQNNSWDKKVATMLEIVSSHLHG